MRKTPAKIKSSKKALQKNSSPKTTEKHSPESHPMKPQHDFRLKICLCRRQRKMPETNQSLGPHHLTQATPRHPLRTIRRNSKTTQRQTP